MLFSCKNISEHSFKGWDCYVSWNCYCCPSYTFVLSRFCQTETKRIRLFDIILGWCVFCFSWKIQTTKIVNSYCVFDVLVRRFRYKTSDEPGLFSLNYDMKHGKFSFTSRGTFCLYNWWILSVMKSYKLNDKYYP